MFCLLYNAYAISHLHGESLLTFIGKYVLYNAYAISHLHGESLLTFKGKYVCNHAGE